ncbi:P-loop containing nucleoside triphosphate hydrolase protein [Annulohypoxylon maeteangense]|uniref:P-loop containing nucleoside triphosphate hydrolase protein n=1 Tax=Annulohypoxylon maeteangense TaxID=1927788 RepID=UPI0020073E67|nr:P-loop containing nucleoside triphosphate hydrolase protein [Annulohypoxylon maeteangense]KAI0888887.1 P-loop containing nucleoside triphosphate hydrolase protein [Annulohypoxylon maeteangense]
MTRIFKMGSYAGNDAVHDQPTPGNLAILTKVDKLRELIGTKVALPQLVVVGDQSSGKSSVLEGLTGFGFPRDAELCTRYATQITCRREIEESINVSIIPHADAPPHEKERVKKFHRTLKTMKQESLAELFREANDAMGIKTSTKSTSADGINLSAFSEHILKIEKLGPDEEHFTVIDVPGIFRKETEGITTEGDIELVRNMVKNYMKDTRTIILAIMPANVDPATQEILKLAKKADPTMTRTMAVLTKPDLAIESTMKNIAIQHVLGRRSDLSLGYYIVKNRGPDDLGMTLEQGQVKERIFFATEPWSVLRNTGRAGVFALKARVRELLVDLIKKEFPKLKADIVKERDGLRSQLDKMGQSRNNQYTQRAYLNRMGEAFQTLARDSLNACYDNDAIFDEQHELRLITRIVDESEKYSDVMSKNGHTRPFESDGPDKDPDESSDPTLARPYPELEDFDCPELEGIFDPSDVIMPTTDKKGDIMGYIESVYKESRGQDLVPISNTVISAIFKDQTKKWKPITLSYMTKVIFEIHLFIKEILKQVCPDERVREELWDGYLLEGLQKSYRVALDQAKLLLKIEREESPMTYNHYYNDNLQKSQAEHFVVALEKLGLEMQAPVDTKHTNVRSFEQGTFLSKAVLKALSLNMGNSEYNLKLIHDILKSYYKVSRKRFVDVICKQAVNHYLLRGEGSPLTIFSTQMVQELNEDQLDMIAAEDAPVKLRREKLVRDIQNFDDALKVLRGSG